MTSKAALCLALLKGVVINIRNIHSLTGYTNAGREIGRSIERLEDDGFGVIVSRTKMEGENRYGVYCTWTNYRLNKTDYNADGIKRMQEYVDKELSTMNILTDSQKSKFKQTALF